ncbi:MAG: LysR family transcriptional regulator [Gammaproteobacteria bacterium]|nr:LysR family transcriptional regulator [Gammaproteobacteria bacterium]
MRLSLHQLKVFQAIAQYQGITSAAKRLHMTQPAVSNILKQLQEYYHQPLVEVIGKRCHLTPAGKILIEAAEQIDHLLLSAHERMELMLGNVAGELSLSIVSTAKYFVPRLLGAFKQLHPQVNIRLKVLNREQVIDRLKNNQDDFVIMSQPPSDMPIDIKPFYQDELVLACSPRHRMLKPKEKSIGALSEETWLFREMGSGTRMVMSKWLQSNQLEPRHSMEIGNNESIKQMIMADMGISLVSKQSIELELNAGLISTLNLAGLPLPHRWYMVRHAKKHGSPLVQAFDAFVQEHSELGHINSSL